MNVIHIRNLKQAFSYFWKKFIESLSLKAMGKIIHQSEHS